MYKYLKSKTKKCKQVHKSEINESRQIWATVTYTMGWVSMKDDINNGRTNPPKQEKMLIEEVITPLIGNKLSR